MILTNPQIGNYGTSSADNESHFAALVMDVTGTTEPALLIHREIAAGTQIAIRHDAQLSLFHYKTCSIVDFSGRTVNVTEQGLEAAKANIKSRKQGPCLHVHEIARIDGRAVQPGGARILRSPSVQSLKIELSSEVSVVAANGLIVIAGAEAPDADWAEVRDSKGKLVGSRIPIRLDSFRLSGDLKQGSIYLIRISLAEPIEVPISISEPDTKSLLIVRLVELETTKTMSTPTKPLGGIVVPR